MKKEIKERQGSIYVFHNLYNDKEYAGQTVRKPEIRWAEHIAAAFVKNDQRPFYRAMRKNWRASGGKSVGFSVEVIWVGPESMLNAAEKRTVRQRRTFIDTGWGYNLTTGGDHAKMSERTKKKLARLARAQWADLVIRAKHAASDARESTHAKRSAAMRGCVRSEETCAKHRIPCKAATRAKISAAHIGRTASDETRAKLSISHMGNTSAKGCIRSAAVRAKLSAAHKGIPWSAARRAAQTLK